MIKDVFVKPREWMGDGPGIISINFGKNWAEVEITQLKT